MSFYSIINDSVIFKCFLLIRIFFQFIKINITVEDCILHSDLGYIACFYISLQLSFYFYFLLLWMSLSLLNAVLLLMSVKFFLWNAPFLQ